MAPIASSWVVGSWADTAWAADTWDAALTLTFIFDLNTRLLKYLQAYYSVDTHDLTTLLARYIGTDPEDATARFQQLIADATASMT